MPAPRYFAILGAMRTGSNLLERTLNQFPDIICHGELFNAAFVAGDGKDSYLGITRAERDADPFRLIARIRETAGARVPGFRIFGDHDQRILAHVARDPDCALVVLRRDPLESYVSLRIAETTGQWLLGDERQRRAATIAFDPADFERYRSVLSDQYARVLWAVRAAGRTAFEIGFEEIKDLRLLNGLAAWLGSRTTLDRIEETIVRQNPGALAEKVSNPEAIAPYLPGAPATRARGPEGVTGRGFVLSRRHPLAFAPLPACPWAPVLRWMASLSGVEATPETATAPGGPLETGLAPDALARRMAEGRLGTLLTVTRHPLERAARTFHDKILASDRGAFEPVRRALVETCGVELPPAAAVQRRDRAALAAIGYDLAAHRRALAGFLTFLRDNLAGRTAIPAAPVWLPQSVHIAALAAVMPPTLIVPEPWLPKAGAFLRAVMGIETGRNAILRMPPPIPLFDAPELWTEELGDLARAAYPEDHARLGYAVAPPGAGAALVTPPDLQQAP